MKLVENIENLFEIEFKFPVRYFTKGEVKEFIQKYKDLSPLIKHKPLEQYAQDVFDDTKGHPIMVRFAVLNRGPLIHVKEMYRCYLTRIMIILTKER